MLFSSRLSLLLVTALLLPLLTTGQDEKAEKPARPLVTKIGENSYRLGEILFDSKEKKIEIPVVVNMNEGGPIEYLLVNENGKVHEAIFTTTISPSELQIVLKLLKFESGHGDVFNRLLAPEVLDKEGGTEAERGDAMEFLFVEEGKDPRPGYEFIIDGENAEPMAPGDWIYTGSTIEEGNFLAEGEGSIIAIYLDHIAMFNMTRDGADIDERWGANGDAIPEIGTKGTLILKASKKPVTN